MFEPYRTEPYSDFRRPEARAAYELALAGVGAALGGHDPLVIGGEHVDAGEPLESRDPCRPSELVGTVAQGGTEHVDQALDAAWGAFASWSTRPAVERAEALVKLAAVLRRRKFEFAAWETYEAGKNWAEAEADVAEAIDFVEYYARSALAMAEPVPVHPWPGEINHSWLQAIGAGAVIPPWNFPLAILVGMSTGPVAAGNTVVIKPASDTPVIAARFLDAVAEAGIPPGVFNLVTGPGAALGDHLVDHPRTRFVNFTGSKEVGLRIAERAAVVHPGQRFLKRAFMELGGKDALIVDETADLEAAAAAAVTSAFGFQGQKCSACSRLIVVDEVYDEVLDRVVTGAGQLDVGPAVDNSAVTAVISGRQHASILAEIESGRDQAKLVLGGDAIDRDGGFYIKPTVFADVPADARLARHEIFGPVLSVLRAADFDDAVRIFNDTDFALTGGLFSRERDRLDRARRELRVGNLYLNRKITGALVGIQPFGGMDMSGSNAKAGGPDYLRLFMEMKTVAERL